METFALLDIIVCKLDFMNIDLHETLKFKFEKEKKC